jgi:hypothetical protein
MGTYYIFKDFSVSYVGAEKKIGIHSASKSPHCDSLSPASYAEGPPKPFFLTL